MKAQENLLLGKIHFILGLLARNIANHSYASNTPLTQALKMYLPRISHDLFVLKKGKAFKFFRFKILGDEVRNALYKTINMSTETSSTCYRTRPY